VLLEIAVGLVGAIVTIAAARAVRGERILVLALIALPLVYAAFALIDGDAAKAGLEVAVGLPFIVAGGYLFRRESAVGLTQIAGAFWLAHGVFDVVRDDWIGNDGVPDWYPAVCLGFDLAVGGYLIVRGRRLVTAR